MPAFLKDHFLHKFGLKKIASAKLTQTLVSASTLARRADAPSRVAAFATVCGIARAELYAPHVGEFYVACLRRAFERC